MLHNNTTIKFKQFFLSAFLFSIILPTFYNFVYSQNQDSSVQLNAQPQNDSVFSSINSDEPVLPNFPELDSILSDDPTKNDVKDLAPYTIPSTSTNSAENTTSIKKSLNFEPKSVNVKKGETFEVDLMVDSGESQEISSVDIKINYDNSLLKPKEIINGGHFPKFNSKIDSDSFYLSLSADDTTTYKTGKGILAKITFETLKDGKDTVTIYCDLSKTDTSKIIANDMNATNILKCSYTESLSVNIGADSPDGDDKKKKIDSPDENAPTPTPPKNLKYEDYFYYVRASSGGKVPEGVVTDFTGDKNTDYNDREIIAKALNENPPPIILPSNKQNDPTDEEDVTESADVDSTNISPTEIEERKNNSKNDQKKQMSIEVTPTEVTPTEKSKNGNSDGDEFSNNQREENIDEEDEEEEVIDIK